LFVRDIFSRLFKHALDKTVKSARLTYLTCVFDVNLKDVKSGN